MNCRDLSPVFDLLFPQAGHRLDGYDASQGCRVVLADLITLQDVLFAILEPNADSKWHGLQNREPVPAH